jgi:hypothetical protein
MKRLAILCAIATLTLGCQEKKALFFAPATAPASRITVIVRVDGQPVVNQVTVLGVGTQNTTPAAVVFEVSPGTYDVSAANPPGAKCTLLSQTVTAAAGQTIEVVFDCFGLAGDWIITYEVIEQNCFDVPPDPFEVPAMLVAQGNQLSVVFPDAPDSIDGLYDPATMVFSGTTDQVPLPGSPDILAQEAYTIMFSQVDGALSFEGESLVTFTFPGGSQCTVRYRVRGQETP